MVSQSSKPITKGQLKYAYELDNNQSKKAIWQSQVPTPFISLHYSSLLLAFKSRVKLRFLESIGNAFRSILRNFNPPNSTTKKSSLKVLYLKWLERVSKYKSTF